MITHRLKAKNIARTPLAGFLYAFSFTIATPVPALADVVSYDVHEQKNWLFRFMLLDVRTVSINSDISIIGGKVKSPDKRTLGADVSYFFTPELSVEFQGGVLKRDYSISNSQIGSFRIGTIQSNSVSLAVQYHFNVCCKFMPYLGVGVNHAWTRKVEPAEGIPDFEVNDINSTIISSGIDYYFSNNWSVSTNFRYIISPDYQFSGHGFDARVKMDTLVSGIGIAYRF